MKKLILLLSIFFTSAFGYNYSGTWVNKSEHRYNDPITLKISGRTVTPYLSKNWRFAKLKSKNATLTGRGLFETWGFENKYITLYIKPISRSQIKVYVKKINTTRRKIITKIFIFAKKDSGSRNIKRRFLGNWRSDNSFSTISKLKIRKINGHLYVKAWGKNPRDYRVLSLTRAKIYNNSLHISWNKGNKTIKATIKGLEYNSYKNRYRRLRLNLSIKNINNRLIDEETIYFSRREHRSTRKHIKIGPVDINRLIHND